MSQIDEVKARIDIVELVSESVKLRRSGRNYSGLCPFHQEKTPSFIVSPERGSWRCFGQCAEGGDAISFMMKKEGWDFSEALKYLAKRAGVELTPFSPKQVEEKEEHDNLRDLLEKAVTFFRHQLVNSTAGEPVLQYLKEKRSLKTETIESWGLGFAPSAWDALSTYLVKAGHSMEDLNAAGLVSARDSGGYYDRFRNRIMIPIRDERGRMAGFGARSLVAEDMPKFLNSPETAIFSKSHLLYGLDRARKPMRASDQAVIVEGYFDVIAVHQAGFENVVSPMGTALTEEQVRLIKRFTRRLVLALDPDAAGQNAVLRGLDAARQSLDTTQEIGFDAHGLLRHESRLQADLRVASMPDGMDPDEVVARDASQWLDLVKAAQPVVVHVMQTLAVGKDLQDARVKSEIASQVLPLIDDLPDPIARDTYLQKLARYLHLDERSLLGQSPFRPKKAKPARRRETVGGSAEVSDRNGDDSPAMLMEQHCVNVLMRRPWLLYRLDRKLQEASLSRMGLEDFGYTDYRELFELVRRSLEQDDSQPEQFIIDHVPDLLKDKVEALLSKPLEFDLLEERDLEKLVNTILKMRRRTIDEDINQSRFLLDEAHQQGDSQSESTYKDRVFETLKTRRMLDQASRRFAGRN